MNEKTYISPQWMFYNVFIFHIGPTFHQYKLSDFFSAFSNGTLTQYGLGQCHVNFYNNGKLNKESYAVNVFECLIISLCSNLGGRGHHQ